MHETPYPHDCDPIDVCASCREPLAFGMGWDHTGPSDHPAIPAVACVECGAMAETVDPDDLGDALEAIVRTINGTAEGQTSWLA